MLNNFINRPYNIRISVLLFILIICIQTKAQINIPGTPYSFNNKLKQAIEYKDIQGFTSSELSRLDSLDKPDKKKPYRFAREIPVTINPNNSGVWEILSNGDKLWRLGIRSKDALSLYIVFDNYRLPEGAKLYLYDTKKTFLLGAYTHINNKNDGVLAVTPVPGEELILEYQEPANTVEPGSLEISHIGYDFKGFYQLINKYGDFGRSGSCNVDINCTVGQDWQIEKRSVCKIISRGFLGTGSLINNTRNDGRALFFTANHVIPDQNRASGMIIYFNYESPECNGGDGSVSYSLSNGEVLSTTDKLDFSLIELSTKPPQAYKPFYAGWDNSGDTPKKGISIHHPRGDVKKISIENNILLTGDYGSGFDSDSHWQIRAWDVGTTEPGSSGSPLFNENHFIVGDLTGGDASCEYNFDDFYQKFSRSWDDYPDPDKQLKFWLDPDGTGTNTLYGYDPFDSEELLADFSWKPGKVIINHELRFQDHSLGYPVEWRWEFENGYPATSTDKNPSGIIFTSTGNNEVKLIITKPHKTDTIIKSVFVDNLVDFRSDFTNIVAGGRVGFEDISSGSPVYRKWIFEGGSPEISDVDDPYIYYSTPGRYKVSLYTAFGNDTLIKVVDNYIEVLDAEIIYNCNFISNISSTEHTGLDSSRVISGYFPGTNSDNIVSYADKFVDTTGIPKEIKRILVPVSKLLGTQTHSYVNFTIWDENFNQISKMEVPMSQLVEGSENILEFPQTVKVDSVFFLGFELDYYIPEDIFAVPMAIGRKDIDQSTLFIQLENDAWYSSKNYYNINTSLGIKPELCARDLKFEENILLYPNPSNGIVNINFGEIVFKTFDLEIFNLAGQRIDYMQNYHQGDIEIDLMNANRGIYLFNIKIDDLNISKKIILMK